jgi:hypothetical protein
MSNIDFEYYYLSGKNIPLRKYKLGVIKQPTLNQFIDLEIDVTRFLQPFILDKNVIFNNNKDMSNLLDDVKDLSFLFLYEQLTKHSIISNLLSSLSVIYNSTNVYVSKSSISIIVESGIDGEKYVIDDTNFHILSTVVCEMMGINKKDMKSSELKTEMTDIEREFERRRQKYMQMQNSNKPKKSEGYTILDIANIVIHFSGLSYNEVFDMTIYQLKNSFKILVKKDNYMVNLLHRISQKFDTSKEKFVHWTDEAKLDISTLNSKD